MLPIACQKKALSHPGNETVVCNSVNCQRKMRYISITTTSIVSRGRIQCTKIKFSIKTFFSFLRIWSHLLKKSLTEKFIFCAVVRSYILSSVISKFSNRINCKNWYIFDMIWKEYVNCNDGGYSVYAIAFFISRSSYSNMNLMLETNRKKRVYFILLKPKFGYLFNSD